MALNEICSKYSWQEIGRIPGDGDFRHKLFKPVLENLFENKIIYYERFICIATLADIKITPERFEATATPYLNIERKDRPNRTKPWNFGAAWSFMSANDGYFSTYGGQWLVWPDKDLVIAVEELARKKDFDAALDLTLNKSR